MKLKVYYLIRPMCLIIVHLWQNVPMDTVIPMSIIKKNMYVWNAASSICMHVLRIYSYIMLKRILYTYARCIHCPVHW